MAQKAEEAASPPTGPLKVPYELRLGVVGHRQLADPASVKAAVESLLQYISATLNRQDETPVKWIVVSALAKGADQLMARAVLNRVPARLEVVTPFPLADYRRDFSDPQDRGELESLLQQALPEHVTELDGNYGASGYDQGANVDSQTHLLRNQAYSEAGHRVVDACEIVIAVWDGEPAAGVGGTAEAVDYALRAQRLVLWIDANKPAVAKQLIAIAPPADDGRRPTPHKTRPLPGTAKKLSVGYDRLTAYTADSAIDAESLAGVVQKEAEKLETRASEAHVPLADLRAAIGHLLPHHVRADRLATHYQHLHVQTTKALHCLAATAVTVVAGQVLFFEHVLWLIGLEIVALYGAVCWLLLCRYQKWHEKWLHYRYLSERLRTAIFILLVGPADHPSAAEGQTVLPFYAGPENWLGATVQQLVSTARQTVSPIEELVPLRTFLKATWLDPQAKWHEQTAHKKHAVAQIGHYVELGFFVGTIILAILHFYGVGHAREGQHPVLVVSNWITFLAIVLPAWGAAVHAIMTQLEYERIGIRSRRMARALNLVAERCARASTLKALRQEVYNGERVIGIENHEWWVLLSFRPPVLPM